VDGATLQGKIYSGYGKAAARLGLLYACFRPQGTLNPLAPGNQYQSILAAFNSEDWTFIKPNKYGKPTWYGLFDATHTLPGDYMVGAGGIFFIAGQQALLSILAVNCNRTIAVVRTSTPAATVGAVPYGGIYPTQETVVLGALTNQVCTTGWPASILVIGRAEASLNTPLSMKNAGWQILLPASVPIFLNAGDLFIDDQGIRYLAEACEQTDLGWRINAKEAHV
jgi:hypothetical protein